MPNSRSPNWAQLRANPDFRLLFESEHVAAEVRRQNKVLFDSNESDPAVIGRARGYLQAIEQLRTLPDRMMSYTSGRSNADPPADEQ